MWITFRTIITTTIIINIIITGIIMSTIAIIAEKRGRAKSMGF